MRSLGSLLCAVVAYLTFATSFVFITPTFEDPDGLDHFGFATILANRSALPVIPGNAARLGRPRIEELPLAHHPPLYYGCLAAILTALDDADIVATPQSNPNYALPVAGGNLRWQHGEDETHPSSEVWTYRILRAFSVACGLASLLLLRAIARHIAPDRPRIGDLAVLIVACVPIWGAVHGCLDNGNLATALALASLLELLRITAASRVGALDGVRLGTLLGLALLSKLTVMFLLPLLIGVAAVAWTRQVARRRELIACALACAITTIALSGWFFGRNLSYYGHPLAQNAHAAYYAANRVPDGQILDYLRIHFLPEIITGPFCTWLTAPWNWHVGFGITLTILGLAGCAIGTRLAPARAGHPVLICVAAAVLNVAQVVHYNTHFIQPQARYLLPAIGLTGIAVAFGLGKLFERIPRAWRSIVVVMTVGALLAANSFTVFRHLASQLDRGDAPAASPCFASLTGKATRAAPSLPLTGVTPNDGAELDSAPTFEWRSVDPAFQSARPMAVRIFDGAGRVYFTSEWFMTAPMIHERYPLASPIFETLPVDEPLYWCARSLPDRARGEGYAGTIGTPIRSFTRRSPSH